MKNISCLLASCRILLHCVRQSYSVLSDHISKQCLTLLGLIVLSVMIGGQAIAATAITTGNVNVRAGPGARYNKVTTLPRGAAVQVNDCRGGWCHVHTSWGYGWVSGRYLASQQPIGRRDAYRPAPESKIYFGLNIGPQWYPDYPPYRVPRHSWRPRPPWRPVWGVGPAYPPPPPAASRPRGPWSIGRGVEPVFPPSSPQPFYSPYAEN